MEKGWKQNGNRMEVDDGDGIGNREQGGNEMKMG